MARRCRQLAGLGEHILVRHPGGTPAPLGALTRTFSVGDPLRGGPVTDRATQQRDRTGDAPGGVLCTVWRLTPRRWATSVTMAPSTSTSETAL